MAKVNDAAQTADGIAPTGDPGAAPGPDRAALKNDAAQTADGIAPTGDPGAAPGPDRAALKKELRKAHKAHGKFRKAEDAFKRCQVEKATNPNFTGPVIPPPPPFDHRRYWELHYLAAGQPVPVRDEPDTDDDDDDDE